MATQRRLFLAVAAVALAGVACGSNGYGSSGGSGGGGGGPTLSITSPANGAKVSEPFMVQVTSSEKLGPTSTGDDHVHLYFDGNQSNYDVCTSTSCPVTSLSPGKHVIQASLRHADHSDAGPKQSITVYVSSGSGSTGGGGGGGGGGGYGGGGGGGGY
ncbi:MAG: Ig-like domain-containing protein [Actinomycetota bacterium]|nr:Ig-like domain-containing protein [Actinomycetota bacterium]